MAKAVATQPGVPPVHPGLALESMRNSSFDTFSAIGELLDNSIEAGARTINILIEQFDANEGKRGRPKIRTLSLAVGDDGNGMDVATMHRCLQLGYSSRYNNRTGIGRFGVGMTLGSINQCKHIAVYSHQVSAPWRYAQLDLEEVEAAGDAAAIAPPIEKEPPAKLASLGGTSSGTIVVWTAIDRMHDNDLKGLAQWAGRTYRKFLSPQVLKDRRNATPELVPNPRQVSIFLNGVLVPPFDPLFVLPNVAGDASATLTETTTVEFEIEDESLDPKEAGRNAPISIRLSLLPKELRPKRGAGGSVDAVLRHIDDNTGFSILRNGREVFFGPWIGVLDMPGGESDGRLVDRYWGMEIEFPATLDNQFQVRNIKTGAKPLAALREQIEKAITPTIVQFRKDIRSYWDEVQLEADKKKPEAAAKHTTAEEIGKTAKPKATPTTPEQTKQIVEKLVPDIASADGSAGEQEVTDWMSGVDDGYKIVESMKAHANGPFIDINPQNAKVFILYTMKHGFFKHVYQQLSNIADATEGSEDGDNAARLSAQSLKDAIDLLLMAFAAAYVDGLATDKEHAEPLLERLLMQWSMTLSMWTRKLAARD